MQITLDIDAAGYVRVVSVDAPYTSMNLLTANISLWAVSDRLRPVSYDRPALHLRQAFGVDADAEPCP